MICGVLFNLLTLRFFSTCEENSCTRNPLKVSQNSFAKSYVCLASSRVGVTIKAPKPSYLLQFKSISFYIIGNKNANVLPLPTLDIPIILYKFNNL